MRTINVMFCRRCGGFYVAKIIVFLPVFCFHGCNAHETLEGNVLVELAQALADLIDNSSDVT